MALKIKSSGANSPHTQKDKMYQSDNRTSTSFAVPISLFEGKTIMSHFINLIVQYPKMECPLRIITVGHRKVGHSYGD
ncbi:predicted protein [Sclerotinia sclerotiorum 1980 UF-70]|uniref:Uncharacterized protein n=1 Tax=Sclerotinia sclerotiorum (strain ATCC 18683 / 1980 / Ss-1) TaxID=665079 RepID=A7EYB4_SCLS1|nr:predicted protein [Sclerotinia sclerotiorum 1980 UF-70]EDN94456.1 predicted protein [Sclerotinia sclerotiorum 1980 UF-70]